MSQICTSYPLKLICGTNYSVADLQLKQHNMSTHQTNNYFSKFFSLSIFATNREKFQTLSYNSMADTGKSRGEKKKRTDEQEHAVVGGGAGDDDA